MSRDHSIRIWANVLYGTLNIYRDLKVGERFRFPTKDNSSEIYIAGKRGWFKTLDGRSFRTGMNTAVIREKEVTS